MQGIQWTSSPLAQICIQEFATNFYQGSLVGLLPSICSHMFIRLCGSTQQQEKCSSSNHHVQMLLTYHHVFYVKLGMSPTPKLWFRVLERISNVMNI
jgi:hypothetical protein